MTTTNRWKLISAVLAGCLSYSWWHGEARSDRTHAMHATHSRHKGPLRLGSAVLGNSTDELIRQLA